MAANIIDLINEVSCEFDVNMIDVLFTLDYDAFIFTYQIARHSSSHTSTDATADPGGDEFA